MKHRSIIREPYQAHASHKAARTGSSYAQGCVSVFVSVRRFFGEDSTDRCLGVVRFFLREFGRLAMPRLMPSVSRMGLCGSLFVVRHSLCQLVSFFQFGVGFFFFGPCLLERLVRNFSFDLSLRKFKFESTSSGVWVSGCAGVCWCLGVFFSVHTCLPLPACLPSKLPFLVFVFVILFLVSSFCEFVFFF